MHITPIYIAFSPNYSLPNFPIEWLEEEYVNHPKANVPKITKLGRKLLSEANSLLYTVVVNEPISKTTKRITKAIKKFERVLIIAESDESFSLAYFDALEKLGVCYKTINNPQKALTYLSRALECKTLLRNEKDKYKEIQNLAIMMVHCKTSKLCLIRLALSVLLMKV